MELSESEAMAARFMNFNYRFMRWMAKNYNVNFNKNRRSSYGLTKNQFGILALINTLETPTLSELIHYTGVSKGSMSFALSKLEEEGYIAKEKEQDKGDRRKTFLIVTGKGHLALEETFQQISEMLSHIFNKLNDEQKQDLNFVFDKMEHIFKL